MDSDEELQEAFAAGLLKPGLHRAVPESGAKKVFVNNVDGLKQKLAELQAPVKSFNWIERLDHVVLKSAPLAPELALKEADLSKKAGKADAGSDVHNDFQREMTFYRQAQATVLEVLPRLQSMGVPTKRPQDYYAQMAKTDDHMQKIREKLVSKQLADERLEKVKKLREMKKFGKKVQIEVQQKRQKEKKDMLDQVKKFRKGQADSIDFLDGEEGFGGGGDKNNKKGGQGSNPAERRKFKDKKFGFGGKKKGMKANTKDSVNDTTSYRRPSAKGGIKQRGKPGGSGGGGAGKKRPGKSKRQKSKSRGGKK